MLSASQLGFLRQLVEFLQPFKEWTDMICSESFPTLCVVYPMTKCIEEANSTLLKDLSTTFPGREGAEWRQIMRAALNIVSHELTEGRLRLEGEEKLFALSACLLNPFLKKRCLFSVEEEEDAWKFIATLCEAVEAEAGDRDACERDDDLQEHCDQGDAERPQTDLLSVGTKRKLFQLLDRAAPLMGSGRNQTVTGQIITEINYYKRGGFRRDNPSPLQCFSFGVLVATIPLSFCCCGSIDLDFCH